MKSHKTRTMKVEYQPRFDELNALSAEVWNECVDITDMWLYAHGYEYFPATHMYYWINSHLSKEQRLHSHSIQFARHTYVKSWKSSNLRAGNPIL